MVGIASITRPITVAAVMLPVDDGLVALDDAPAYGWVGGTGTTAHVDPALGVVGILFTQKQMTGPTPTPLRREFWAYAFRPGAQAISATSAASRTKRESVFSARQSRSSWSAARLSSSSGARNSSSIPLMIVRNSVS
jgi:CubicO group peptidase (beta-lactamase class C family)